MEQVVGRFRARRVGARGSFASRLARTGRCRVCEALDRAPAGVTFAGSNSDELAAEANRLRFTREWPQQTRAVWQPHYLEGLGARLDALGRSMRQGAAAPTVEQEGEPRAGRPRPRAACWNLLRRVDDTWRVEQVDQLGAL